MGLGLGIVLLVLGLVLVTGTLNMNLDFVDDSTLGWILLLAGLLSIVLGLVTSRQRSRSTHVEEHRVDRRG